MPIDVMVAAHNVNFAGTDILFIYLQIVVFFYDYLIIHYR